jgi:hypothetical protein
MAHAAANRHHVSQIACFQPFDRCCTSEGGVGPIQPGRFGQGRDIEHSENLSQAWNHAIGPLRIELAERKAQTSVVSDRQQRSGLGSVVWGLPAAGLKQLSHLISTDRATQQLTPQLKPLPQGPKLQGHRISGCRPQPSLQVIAEARSDVASQGNQGLGRLEPLLLIQGSCGQTCRLGEGGRRKVVRWEGPEAMERAALG